MQGKFTQFFFSLTAGDFIRISVTRVGRQTVKSVCVCKWQTVYLTFLNRV